MQEEKIYCNVNKKTATTRNVIAADGILKYYLKSLRLELIKTNTSVGYYFFLLINYEV